MTTLTLASIEQALAQPFAPEDIKYLPKSPRQKKSGEWVCLALPYADKRAYEDRLNDLAFGYWSTPHNPPYAIGNKLIIPVTVTLFDIEHTDYGEAFINSVSRKGEVREEENSATVAYSQGFRRACAQFRLGRYLYLLPKVWVPYDPATKTFAWTDEQRLQLTLRLYKKAQVCVPDPRCVQRIGSPDGLGEPGEREQKDTAMVPASVKPVLPEETSASLAPGSVSSSHQPGSITLTPQDNESFQDVSLKGVAPQVDPSAQKRQWLERKLKYNRERIERICEQYQVRTLDQLSEAQFVHLANRIYATQQRAQQKKNGSASPRRVVAATVLAPVQQ